MGPDLKRLRVLVGELNIGPVKASQDDEITAIDITAMICAFATMVLVFVNAANQAQTPSMIGTSIIAGISYFVVGGFVHVFLTAMDYLLAFLWQNWWLAVFVGIGLLLLLN